MRTVRFSADGVYRVGVTSLQDESGLFVNLTTTETFVRDATDPTGKIDGPNHVEAGDYGRFNGSASTDNVGVVYYEWTVDGETVGNGSTFEYAFAEPGTHQVGLTVADEGRQRGRGELVGHGSRRPEQARRHGREDQRQRQARRRGEFEPDRGRVRIADEYGRLAGDDDVTVRSLQVTLPTNETLRLNVSGNATAPGFESTTGREGAHGRRHRARQPGVADPTFRFSVSASRLSRAGISYSDVALYRDDGNWTELPTEVVRATKSTVVYEAESPGLSTFVVGASGASATGSQASDGASVNSDGGNGGDVRVADASLVRDSVPLGEYLVVEVTLANDGTESGARSSRDSLSVPR